MPDKQATFLRNIERYSDECCAGHDPAHDNMHLARVVTNARSILRGEQAADPLITLSAAWLHDIVQLPKGTGQPGESALRSAQAATVFLEELGLEADVVRRIAHAIHAHSYSGGMKPETIEAAIVQDADRLDAIGAIGIARLWVTAGVMGSQLHHPDDPACSHRDLDDRAFGLDHIESKLLKLPGLMNTATARDIARERAGFVAEFRARFLDELAGTA